MTDKTENKLSRLVLSYGAGIFGNKETNISADIARRKRLFVVIGVVAGLVLLGLLLGVLFGLNVFSGQKGSSRQGKKLNNINWPCPMHKNIIKKACPI